MLGRPLKPNEVVHHSDFYESDVEYINVNDSINGTIPNDKQFIKMT